MKKGFTLVELLAVIVILAVILVIAVPQISSVIKSTKKNSLGSTAKLIAAKAEEKEIENGVLGIEETMTCASLVTLDDNYGNCTVSKVNGHWTVTIDGAGRFAGLSCTGTKANMNCGAEDANNQTINGISLVVDLDGGNSNQTFEDTYETDDVIILEAPMKEGYEFSEWIIMSGDATLNNDELTIGTEDVTISANYVGCPSGTYNDGTTTNCEICTAGTYSEGYASTCSLCTGDKTSDDESDSCTLDCPNGSDVETWSDSETCTIVSCSSGYILSDNMCEKDYGGGDIGDDPI